MGVVVPLDEDRGRGQNAVAELQALVRPEMEAVNDFIRERMASDVPMIPELASHLINSGGKRLRPMLTIAASRMCDYTGNDHIKLAATVEFLHTATLLHDDVVDESDMRRGSKTARMLWGNQASVLVGDFLLGRAFKLMVETKSLRALEIIADAASIIAEGEVMQLAAAKDTSTTEDAYLRVISAKTAALFAAASEIGAVISKREGNEAAALHSYGRNLGIAFQLIDDALDYAGDTKNLGKEIGDDFREGKVTLPVILAYRRGTASERNFWSRVITAGDIQPGDLEEAVALMNRYDAIETTIARARIYGDRARDAMAAFDDSAEREALQDVVAFCIDRAY